MGAVSPTPAPTLAWLQLALDEQDVVEVKTQVNAAAGRVDVLVGEGLRAAVQPDPEAGAVAFHGALAIRSDATDAQKDALLDRLGEREDGVEFAVVDARWLAFRRILPPEEVATAARLGEAFRAFLAQSLGALEEVDADRLL